MKQTTYMCPFCFDNDEPIIKLSLSQYECPLCSRKFRQRDLIGYEITKVDYVSHWRKKIHPGKSYHLMDGIEIKKKDKDIQQMENMVQESTDNLMHEIIMIRIYDKNSKAEKLREKDESDEIQAIKTEIDKLFDTILGRD